MQCEVFNGPIRFAQDRINQWLKQNRVKVEFMTQSSHMCSGITPELVISVWYTEIQ